MGAKLVKFGFRPKDNEQINATIKVQEEHRSVIHGVVLGCDDKPVKDAVVKLFILKDPCDEHSLQPVTHTFTDECGQFLFGPLCPNKDYVIKIWYNDVNCTDLVIRPIHCDDFCLDGCHKYQSKHSEGQEEED